MSAFEFYQKKKLNLQLKPAKIKSNGPTASTPLPVSTMFNGISPGPSISNVFLGSPIVGSESKKELKKKAAKEEVHREENIETDYLKKKKEKKHKKKSLSEIGTEILKAKPLIGIADDFSEDSEDVFVQKKIKPILPQKKKKKRSSEEARLNRSVDVDKSGAENTGENVDDTSQDTAVFVEKKIKLLHPKKKQRERSSAKAKLNGSIEADRLPVGIKRKAGSSSNSENATPNKKHKPDTDEERFENTLRKQKAKQTDSQATGEEMLSWILNPITVAEFFEKYWEKKPLHIPRNDVNYFDGICSKQHIDEALRKCHVNLNKNVSVTSYENGERTTDATPGRARPNAVWDKFREGHSIRLLNPQTFVPNIGFMVATLQEYFRCMVGVNSYLTPAGTQGFAPHYDDIEAFCLQLEGQKHWKVYPPISEDETLPRFSSKDFSQDEIGEPVLEVTLEAGDLLYFPRGWVHQARSVDDHHSLHITVSTYQCNTWGDYLKTALPMALDSAMYSEVTLREGLPLDFIDEMGAGVGGGVTARKSEIIQTASRLFEKILTHCPWDEAADELGKEFIHSSFPPPHEEIDERKLNRLLMNPLKASIRLIAANACRVCYEGERIVCYYSTDNSIEPKGDELLGFELSAEEDEVVRRLRADYPRYTKCSQLITEEFNVEALVELLKALSHRALISIKKPKEK